MAITLVAVNLASVCVESLLYGIFCILFILSLHFITKATPRYPHPKPMLVFSIVMFLAVSAHWTLSIVRAFQAFIRHGGHDPLDFLSDASQFPTVLRESVLLGVLVIGDLTSVYRMWAIWNHHRGVIIIPMILLTGLIALAGMSIYACAGLGADPLHNPGKLEANTFVWTVALWATTLSINFYSTAMIGYKLLQASEVTYADADISYFMFITTVLVESLSLYTIWGVLFLIFYGLQSPLYILLSDAQPPITGITFMILHVRSGMRRPNFSTLSVDGSVSGTVVQAQNR